MNYDEDPGVIAHTQQNETILNPGISIIQKLNSEFIKKHCYSFFKENTMPLLIGTSFGEVPLKFYTYIVCTYLVLSNFSTKKARLSAGKRLTKTLFNSI